MCCGARIKGRVFARPIGATAIRLTITDFASRYLIACEALSTTKSGTRLRVFERAFEDFGLPHAIRTDNGVPVRLGSRALRAE